MLSLTRERQSFIRGTNIQHEVNVKKKLLVTAVETNFFNVKKKNLKVTAVETDFFNVKKKPESNGRRN